MAISCRDVDRQEGAATVNQEMNLAVALAAVSGDASRALTTQRRRAVLAIGSLPLPTSLALSVIATIVSAMIAVKTPPSLELWKRA